MASADEATDTDVVTTSTSTVPEAKATAPEASKPESDKPETAPLKVAETKKSDSKAEEAPAEKKPAPAETVAQGNESSKGDPEEADSSDEAPAVDKPATQKTRTDEPAVDPQNTTEDTQKPENAQKPEKTQKPAKGKLGIVKVVLPADYKGPQDALPGGAGWKFTVSAPTAVEGTTTGTTGDDSATSFTITLDEGRTAPVTVTEAGRDGYSYVGAQCVLDDSKNTPVAHTQLDGAAFQVKVKTKKTTICVVYNRVDKKSLAPLKVKKTASPLFDRDYDWTVEKTTTSQSTAKVKPGQNATFDYRVVATPSAAQDSNFRITGTISITNPNKVAVPVTVTDDLGIEGATCTIADATNPIVPAADTLTLTYQCQLPDSTTDTTTGKNTAKVTWDGGNATAHAPFAFSPDAAVVTDRTVELSDTAPEFGGTRTLDALDGPQTFTYSRALGEHVTSGTCQTFPNTASIPATTDQPELTDNADVKVCAKRESAVKGVTEEDSGDGADQLAYTGSETDGLLGLAGLAAASGIVLRALARRRRDEGGTD